LSRAWTWTSGVRGGRLTSWAMARSRNYRMLF
jgi:hypothetical protein